MNNGETGEKEMPKPKTQVIKMDKIFDIKEIFFFCCCLTLSKALFLSYLAEIFIKNNWKNLSGSDKIKVLVNSLRTTSASVNLQRACHNIVLLDMNKNNFRTLYDFFEQFDFFDPSFFSASVRMTINSRNLD